MTTIDIDLSKLLGFRLLDETEAQGLRLGAKTGVKDGRKVGSKVGAKPTVDIS